MVKASSSLARTAKGKLVPDNSFLHRTVNIQHILQ